MGATGVLPCPGPEAHPGGMGQTAAMTTRSRRLARALGLPVLALALGACGGTTGPTAPTLAPTDAPSSSAPPSVAPPASGAASVAPSSDPAPSGLGQSETAWGRIWDGVPEGFPRFGGGRDGDDATAEPVSDVYVVEGGDAADIATWIQAAMEAATYSTESLSGPLEGGDFQLESVGDAGCRILTTITPQGNLVLVSVLYGAECPAS